MTVRPARVAAPHRLIHLVMLLLVALPLAAATGSVEARPAPGERFDPGRLVQSLYARRDPYVFTHNTALLTLQLTNLGIIGNPWIPEISAGWRGGEYLFQAGLWIGAIGEDQEPHVSTSIFPNDVEFRPSLLPVDTIYEAFEGGRGGNRSTEASNADDDGDGFEDEDFLNGKDDDFDGQIDEDFAAIGQQMLACEYRDDTPEAANQINSHRPLGLLVRQRSFQWSTVGINEFTGFDFEVINVGDQRLRDMYIGFFVDADAGPKAASNYWIDDLVGFLQVDTLLADAGQSGQCARRQLRMDIAYIYDAPDNGGSIVGGDVPGYFGGMFLGHTTDPAGIKAPVRVGLSTVRWTASSAPYPEGDPDTDVERYDLLSRSGVPTRPPSKADDYRFTLGAGPFLSLEPGERIDFQVAFVIGDGLSGMVENAVNAQIVFNGRHLDVDGNPETGVGGRERCLTAADPRFPVFWDDPCDTLNSTQAFQFTNCVPAAFVDDDCNPCTGVTGRESLLNWVGTTAPPPPLANTDPDLFRDIDAPAMPNAEIYVGAPQGDRRITLQWDNASEISRDPISGLDFFEGYRIWRVDNWQRPEGAIGPTPQDWMLAAEFRRHPVDGLGSESPNSLRRVLQSERDSVKVMTDHGPQYFIGRYEWDDERGVINGRVYFYAITAFGVLTRRNPITGLLETVELGGSPSAVQKEMVATSWAPGNGCDAVKVVPNPYRGGADWDLGVSDCDPTGTKIAFRGLPADWTRLKIHSLAGDLIIEAYPGDSRVIGACTSSDANRQSGTFYWDLITRSGQNITSGIYLYVVEASGSACRGRFVVIR
ncbi:MAG: hypothetical protein SGI90_03470 [Candidatus Eisenbacteria bacterium]|nr:hypothetical protein [Candidatus Eisenbacteria bacterium]